MPVKNWLATSSWASEQEDQMKAILAVVFCTLMLSACDDQGRGGGIPSGPEADFYRQQRMDNPDGF